MRPTIVFKLHNETEFPQSMVDDAPLQGPFDDYADCILSSYNVEVSLSDSIKYLKGVGAWDTEELQDLETNKARLLWLALLDCNENETNLFYMGE